MFVRKDKDGNLVAVGSIDHNRLAQLRARPKKASAKSDEPKPATDEPKPATDEPKPATDEPKPAAEEPKAKSSTVTPRP